MRKATSQVVEVVRNPLQIQGKAKANAKAEAAKDVHNAVVDVAEHSNGHSKFHFRDEPGTKTASAKRKIGHEHARFNEGFRQGFQQ